MFAVPQEQIVRVHASSGTTGQPTVVGYTQNDINTWSDVVARSLRAAGDLSKNTGQVIQVSAMGYLLGSRTYAKLWGRKSTISQGRWFGNCG